MHNIVDITDRRLQLIINMLNQDITTRTAQQDRNKHKYIELKNSLEGGGWISAYLNDWADRILDLVPGKKELLDKFKALKTQDEKIEFILNNYSKEEKEAARQFFANADVKKMQKIAPEMFKSAFLIQDNVTKFRVMAGVNEVINEYKQKQQQQ